MEPLVRTLICPHCKEANVEFQHTAETDCAHCGFHAAVYTDRSLAARHYKKLLADDSVIVSNPVRFDGDRWLIAHTRLFLA